MGLSLFSPSYNEKIKRKGGYSFLKQITKEDMQKLIKNNYITNSRKGFVDKRGFVIGFSRTRNKYYIEDKYADIAKKLV